MARAFGIWSPSSGRRRTVAIASADGHHMMHMYAQPGVPRQGGMREMPAPTLPFGPDLASPRRLRSRGCTGSGSKLRHGGQIITAPFTVEVK